MIENIDTPKFQTQIEQATGTIVGDFAIQYLTYIQETPDQWLVKESLDDVNCTTFIAPSQGNSLIEILQRRRLLLLYGADRMGKAALARYVAASLIQQTDLPLSVQRMRQNSSLPDVVDFLNNQQNTIVIGYDKKATEVEEALREFGEIVQGGTNFVILTFDQPGDWQIAPSIYRDWAVEIKAGFPYTAQNLIELLEIQLGQRKDVLEQQIGSLRSFVKDFASPSKIVRLVETLPYQLELMNKEAWIELRNAINDVQLEVHRWVRNLNKDERYLVLTLALFNDLPEQDFWNIYEDLIEILRKRDPTLLKLDYYALYAAKAFIKHDIQVSFNETEYRNVILKQLLVQYRRSLITLLPYLQNMVIGQSQQRFDRGLRIAAAEAVGLIGTVEWDKSKAVLLGWAAFNNAPVSAAASHAFRQMVQTLGDEILPKILQELDKWLQEYTPLRGEDTPDKWRIRWTAASTLGRISSFVSTEGFASEILPRLKNLAEDQNFHVRTSAIYALRIVGLSWFNQVRSILTNCATDWHKSVQLEVATTLHRLSLTRWLDVQNLLDEWLNNDNNELLWTSFCTILLLSNQKNSNPSANLYARIIENPQARKSVQLKVGELLRGSELPEKKTVTLMERMAEREDSITLSRLLMPALVDALYFDAPMATKLLAVWGRSSSPRLRELTQIIPQQLENYRIEKRLEWQRFLTQNLSNKEALRAFAEKLPNSQKETFWLDVEKAEEVRRRNRNLLVAGVIIACFILVIITVVAYSLFQRIF